MSKLCTFNTWLACSLLWTAIIAYCAWSSWPQLPLDSGTDPATQALLREASLSHGLQFGLLAAVPPALALAFGTALCRKRTGGD